MGQMLNYPKLDLPTAAETLAFRMVDQTLRADPVCKRVFGDRIYSWKGDALDDAEPSLDQLPWMRLTPSAEVSDWENVDQHRQPMLVTIELAVVGTNSDNLMNLYGVVRAALFPQGQTQRMAVQTAAQAAGVTKARLTRAGYAAKLDAKTGSKMLLAAGGIELLLLINT